MTYNLISKQAKDLKEYFTKQDIRMANHYRKKDQ